MTLVPIACPGCSYYGSTHLIGCLKDPAQNTFVSIGGCGLEKPADVPKEFVTELKLEPVKVMIDQKLIPSSGTKIVCTTCGRSDWHTLLLRRKAGLLEGLCKMEDGSGCYPLASRRNCQYTYPEQIDCPKLAEYTICLGTELLNPRDVCRDHVGEMLRHGPLYQVWPLED